MDRRFKGRHLVKTAGLVELVMAGPVVWARDGGRDTRHYSAGGAADRFGTERKGNDGQGGVVGSGG